MKNKTKKVISASVGLAALALAGYETWALVNGDQEDTLSESYWKIIAKNPVINLFTGILIGHLGWQSADVIEHFRNEDKGKKKK